MSDVNKESAQFIILVDQNGVSIADGKKVCEPEDAERIIFVTTSGDQA